jgi:hypothetical protein
VLLASSGDQVSCYTTVGGDCDVVLLKDLNLTKSLLLATYFEKNCHSLCHFHS